MDFFVPAPGASPSFQGSTLILPQPSLGSVAQLASDLIAHTLQGWHVVGYLGLQDTVPVVSGLDEQADETDRASDPTRQGITFAVQVYQSPSSEHTLVLPRAPVIRARRQRYLESVRAWTTSNAFKQVFVVCGADAAMRADDSIRESTPFRYLSFGARSELEPRLAALGPHFDWRARKTASAAAAAAAEQRSDSAQQPMSETVPAIPHGGLTRALLETFIGGQSADKTSTPTVPVAALITYTAEGDNTQLAAMVADAMAQTLALDVPSDSDAEVGKNAGSKVGRWTKPPSWNSGLMGQALTWDSRSEMFG